MTRLLKKNFERFFAEEAAKRLGKSWDLGADRESPDFIVTEGAHRFGLEVTELFAGPSDGGGSAMKRAESKTRGVVDSLRTRYEKTADVPLRVQLVGKMTGPNIDSVFSKLVAEDFQSKPVLHHVVIDTHNGLRAHVTKALRPDWFSVNDRVGWVHRDPIEKIADAIETKSAHLPKHREAAGQDVRLLLVANLINNSGKLKVERPLAFDLMGFRAVYLFCYPDSVTVFEDVVVAA